MKTLYKKILAKRQDEQEAEDSTHEGVGVSPRNEEGRVRGKCLDEVLQLFENEEWMRPGKEQ